MWYGQVESKDDVGRVNGCTKIVVEWDSPCWQAKEHLQDSVSTDWSLMGFNSWDALNRTSWRKATGRKTNPSEPGDTAVK